MNYKCTSHNSFAMVTQAVYMRSTQRLSSHNHVTSLGHQFVWCNSNPVYLCLTVVCLLINTYSTVVKTFCIHVTKIT